MTRVRVPGQALATSLPRPVPFIIIYIVFFYFYPIPNFLLYTAFYVPSLNPFPRVFKLTLLTLNLV